MTESTEIVPAKNLASMGDGRIHLDPATSEVRIAADATVEDFGRLLRWLGDAKRQFTMVLARTLAAGRERFGDDAVEQQLDLSGLTYADVRHAMDIAEGLPLFCWKATLSPEHHHLVSKADMDAPEKEKWMRIAEEKGLTVRELQQSLIAGRIVRAAEIEKQRGENVMIVTLEGRISGLMDLVSAGHWQNPSEWPLARLRVTREKFRPLAEYLMDLNVTYNARRNGGEQEDA